MYSADILEQIFQPSSMIVVYELLALTVIRHEDAFTSFIFNDPKKRWNRNNLHLFQSRLEEAYAFAQVTQPERNAWKKEVTEAFISLNYTGLPMKTISQGGLEINVDPREIMTHINDIAKHSQQNSQLMMNLMGCFSKLSIQVERMERILQALDSNNIQHTPNAVEQAPLPLSTVPSWDYVSETLRGISAPVEKFVQYYTLQGSLSYEQYKSNCSTKIDAKVSKDAGNLKKFAKAMLDSTHSEMPIRPTSDPSLLNQWERNVRTLAESAYAHVSLYLGKTNPTYTQIRDMKAINVLEDQGIEAVEMIR